MKHKILIIGGAGFTGINAANYFLGKGHVVSIFDNFSRNGSRENLKWLQGKFPEVDVIEGDVRNKNEVDLALKSKEAILHLAGQVAVTTSVIDPRSDFETNTLGTFNVLEAARLSGKRPLVIYSSTNKVYGNTETIDILEKETRYEYKSLANGISESQPMDFYSPYGCSKGAADQYVHDYARIYNLPTVVFRQSCIYGSRQFGVEDQGWIAWFIIAATLGKPITIYGNGKQVRDLLYIDDLICLYEIAIENIAVAAGKIYNIGGGANNSISVWLELQPLLEKLFNKKIDVSYADWRPGDQKIYISDIGKVKKELGWQPKIGVEEGITKLFKWVQENKKLFTE